MKRKFFILQILVFLSASQLCAQHIVSTYAGSSNGYEDGDTANAKFKGPFGLCIDAFDNLFIADADNHCIRKITPAGIVSTYAGTGVAGYADGDGSVAQFNSPSDLCVDADGNLFVSDFANQRIRKIDTDGQVTTIAGNGLEGYVDGEADAAEFDYPRGIVIDSEGNLFISDSWNHRIRKINVADNTVTTIAGGGLNMGVSSEGDLADGSDTTARFYTPSGLGIDIFDNLYVADAYNHRIRMISTTGYVTTIAGSGSTGPGEGGYADGDPLAALLNTPTELFVAPDGIIYIGDTYNNVVRILSGFLLSTLAGNTNSGYIDGEASIAEFKFTRGVVMDASGEHLFVCDYTNKKIRKIWLNVQVGVDDFVTTSSLFNIYPNPNCGSFQMVLQSELFSGDRLLQIESINGRVIIEQFVNREILLLDFRNLLPAGIYIIRLTGDGIDATQRLIIN